MSLRILALGAAFLTLPGAALAVTATKIDAAITQAEVEAAQQAWGQALVQISTDYAEGGIDQARATAESVLDAAYGYDLGPVLFKPTLTGGEQTLDQEMLPQLGGVHAAGVVRVDRVAGFDMRHQGSFHRKSSRRGVKLSISTPSSRHRQPCSAPEGMMKASPGPTSDGWPSTVKR